MQINFAQPLWLWGLLLIPCGIGWYLYWHKLRKAPMQGLAKFIDKHLLPYIVVNAPTSAKRNYFGILYAVFVACIVLALANPRWSYTDIDAFNPTASMVVLLDLSATMNATDIAPSRIGRARQYIEDLINNSNGLKIGLIGFAGQAHLISPITDDINTIKNYLPALDTDLTDKQGNSFQSALLMADDLLAAEPGDKKTVLLVSDGNFAGDFYNQISILSLHKIQLHVVGIGSTTGAPFRNNQGQIQKKQGKVITSKLDEEKLQEIARIGQGIYTTPSVSDHGLKAILSRAEQRTQEGVVAGKIRQWEDRYYLFLIPAAGILFYLMRARVIYFAIIAIALQGTSFSVKANVVSDLFLNSDQKGQKSYIDGDFKGAAERFNDPYHKGVALYRAGEYSLAEEQFMQEPQRPEIQLSARYNAGNAQMQQKKWRAAIDSYEEVLKVDPENFAALHNLELARKMLEEEPEQEQEEDDKDCDCDNKKEQKNGKQQNKSGKEKTANNKQGKEQNENEQQQAKEQNSAEDKKEQQAKEQEPLSEMVENKSDPANPKDMNEQKSNLEKREQQKIAQVQLTPEEEARLEQWINRVDSDIKVFLKNKFYVEDMLGAQ